MNKLWIPAISALLLAGCGIPAPRQSIPVTDSQGRPLYNSQQPAGQSQTQASASQTMPAPVQPSPVSVIAQPTGSGLSVYPSGNSATTWPTAPSSNEPGNIYVTPQPVVQPGSSTLAGSAFSSVPSVQPLLQMASNEQAGGNLSAAMGNLERARQIAPNDPVVLYRLAEVHLQQGNAQQSEQLARQALAHTSGQQPLTASLWDLVARCRDQAGDAVGAAQARQNARIIQ